MISLRLPSIARNLPAVRRESLSTVVGAWLQEIEPLWVCGLALLLIMADSCWLYLANRHLPGMSASLPGSSEDMSFALLKRRDWFHYVMLGTLYPLLLLPLSLPIRLRVLTPPVLRGIRIFLAAWCVLAACIYTVRSGSADTVAIILVPCLTLLLLARFAPHAPETTGLIARRSHLLTILLVLAFAWAASAQLIYMKLHLFALPGLVELTRAASWRTVGDSVASVGRIAALALLFAGMRLQTRRGLGKSVVTRIVSGAVVALCLFITVIQFREVILLAFALFLAVVSLYRERPAEWELRWLWVGDALAILVLGMASLRVSGHFEGAAYHHWGVFVGPAALVRQGGWLLWDVPTQYGFLSTLTIAFLPARSVWQSLYIANAFLIFLSATFLYGVLRSLRKGLVPLCFAALLTLGAVFLFSGPPDLFPSTGAYRFFWCYAMLAVLLWEFRCGADGRRQARILALGCVVWLLGVLWSSESAVYCSTIWLPAYLLIVWRRARAELPPHPDADYKGTRRLESLRWKVRVFCGHGKGRQPEGPESKPVFPSDGRKRTWMAMSGWLSLPVLLLVGALCVISAYYRLRLGHSPDWSAFSDYSRAFQSGFGALPIDPLGNVWLLFFAFCAVATVCVYLLRESPFHPALGLMVGCGGALWATSSYFIGRSHPENVCNLAPIVVTVIALVLTCLTRLRKTEPWMALVKLSFVPLLAIMVAGTLDTWGGLPRYIASLRGGYARDVARRLPPVDLSLAQLLQTAGLRDGAPLLYADRNLMPVWTQPSGDRNDRIATARAWMPVAPFALFYPLPEDRQAVYIARFTERARLSGWLVENRKSELLSGDNLCIDWFKRQLLRTHTPTKVLENADYRLTWYERHTGPQSPKHTAFESRYVRHALL